MYLEAVTVCVGYCDTLCETENFVRPHLDRWLIVTSSADEETRDFCRNRGMECLVTDDFYRGGPGTFDKAMGVDRGLQMLSHSDWLLHIDADIVLPSHFRESLVDAYVDPTCIYGMDRFMIRGWDQWQRLKASGYFHKYSRCSHHNVTFPEGFPVGARWADTVQGYCPIGFAQLWNREADTWRGIRTKRYGNYQHSDAARTDVQHSLGWDRRKRVLLPEIVVGHIESDSIPAKVGANWNGRKTKRFGPPSNLSETLICPS